jgi:CRISPR/Cas system-associated exonuclease Cas4 (RecB family)
MTLSTRGNKPSSSGIEALFLCNGKFKAELGLPHVDSVHSEEGNLLHLAVTEDREALNKLTHDQKELVETCWKFQQEVSGIYLNKVDRHVVEERLWLLERMSGQPDLVVFGTRKEAGKTLDVAIIYDWKFGMKQVSHASDNWQLRSEAIMLMKQQSLDRIAVAICQPAIQSYSYYEYTEAELAEYEVELNDLLDICEDEYANRTPHPNACHFCKAKLVCPEATALVSKAAMSQIQTLDPAKLFELWKQSQVVKGILKAVDEEIHKQALAHPEQFPELGFTKPQNRRRITDISKAFEILQLAGVTPKEFASCCKASITDVDALLVSKGIERAATDILADAIETYQTSPSLKLRKPIPELILNNKQIGE